MNKLSKLFMALSILSFAVPAFAQGGAESGVNWVAIAAGFSMAFASGICNPAARPGIQLALILGLALIESLALYTLVIIFAKVK
jgi:F-type H+-transporting ATPase subunit c